MSTESDGFERLRDFVVENPLSIVVGIVGLYLLYDFVNQILSGSLLISDLGVSVWDGIVLGLIVGLAGVGLSMTYSILNFANFAHGDYITVGGFVGWGVSYLVVGIGSDLNLGHLLLIGPSGTIFPTELNITVLRNPFAIVLGLLAAGLFTVLLVLLIDKVVYKPMRGEGGITLLITSVGVAFTLRYLIAFVYGVGNRGTTPISKITSWELYLIDGNVSISSHELTLVIVSVILMASVHILLQRTKLGKAMRAMSDNKDLALITGIPNERVIRWTWMIGGGLTGVAGYLIVLERGNIGFQFGWLLLLLIFSAVILGGIGSIYGAIVGGLVIGLVNSLSLIWIPSDFTKAAAFAMMILILLFKPQGIFGGRMTA